MLSQNSWEAQGGPWNLKIPDSMLWCCLHKFRYITLCWLVEGTYRNLWTPQCIRAWPLKRHMLFCYVCFVTDLKCWWLTVVWLLSKFLVCKNGFSVNNCAYATPAKVSKKFCTWLLTALEPWSLTERFAIEMDLLVHSEEVHVWIRVVFHPVRRPWRPQKRVYYLDTTGRQTS